MSYIQKWVRSCRIGRLLLVVLLAPAACNSPQQDDAMLQPAPWFESQHLFEPGSAKLSGRGTEIVKRLAARLNENPGSKVYVYVEKGRDRDNLKLEEERAEVVWNTLMREGVPNRSLEWPIETTVAYGSADRKAATLVVEFSPGIVSHSDYKPPRRL